MEPREIGMPDLESEKASLKEYEQRKFAIAEIIRSAQAVDTKDETLLTESRELLARLAEDRFNLLVVGRFSRGKSTLLNAILGGEYLPTGIVPLTSAITTVRYGSRKQVVLHFIDSRLSSQVSLSQLSQYVTQKENPGNVKRLAYAEIQFPVEILRRGLFFVDSPGLGSPILENTLTTERFLPEADAFVLVTSYESPLSEEEDRILSRIRNTGKKLFVVMNKQDTVDAAERAEAIQFVASRIERFSFAETPQIFSISARNGLAAKQKRDPDQLEASGIQRFEGTLMRFLIEERAQMFLKNMYQRTATFLTQRSQSVVQADLREKFQSLSERLLGSRDAVAEKSETPLHPTLESLTSETYSLEVDQKTGCRICGTVLDAVFQFLSSFQYELTIDPGVQSDHAQRGGFCQLHTWQYEGIASPQGICEGYPRLVHRIADELKNFGTSAAQGSNVSAGMKRLCPSTRNCILCQTRIEAERRAVEEVAATLRQAQDSNARMPACCLPHLKLVTEVIGPGQISSRFLTAHAALMERTAEDLQRYALKHSALRRHLASEEERSASILALLLLAGHRNVSTPWAIESI